MKRKLRGTYKIIGIYICDCPIQKALLVLPWNMAKLWEAKKGYDSIALIWNGKLHFRQLYYRRDGWGFKFFNRFIYIEDIISCNEVISFE